MRALVLLASKIGPASVPVLISGETGVGKEVVAELIHAYSERREKPMVCFLQSGGYAVLDSRLTNGLLTAIKVFVDKNGVTNTVTIQNGLISAWTP